MYLIRERLYAHPVVKTIIPRHEMATVQGQPCARVILNTFAYKVIVFCVHFPLLNQH